MVAAETVQVEAHRDVGVRASAGRVRDREPDGAVTCGRPERPPAASATSDAPPPISSPRLESLPGILADHGRERDGEAAAPRTVCSARRRPRERWRRCAIFRAKPAADFLAHEFARFCDQLRSFLDSASASASFEHTEQQVGSRIELDDAGSCKLTAWVAEHVGSGLEVRESRTERAHLVRALRELDAIVAAFPARGEL